jgi:transcriptional regulator with XRE-family HTH domain
MRTSGVDIGERIREARKLAGVRVAELATALGVVKFTVYRWEVGYHRASIDSLNEIADYLRVSRAWLITGEGKARAA